MVSMDRIARLFRRLVKDASAVAAVEFAFILPVMLTLYLGGVQLSDALTVSRKVSHVASALGDLVTQSSTITNADMKNILDAAASIMAPYSDATLKMKVSGITIDANGKATVTWSDARHDTPLTKNAPVTLPDGVNQKNTFIVTAEIHYPYTPTLGSAMTGTYDIRDQFYLRPRLTNDVKRTAN
jgi:Flp pilus assembly protein TadG